MSWSLPHISIVRNGAALLMRAMTVIVEHSGASICRRSNSDYDTSAIRYSRYGVFDSSSATKYLTFYARSGLYFIHRLFDLKNRKA